MIEAKSVTKTYGGVRPCTALSRIDLRLPNIGVVLITGESGSGKTTLLNVLSALDEPTEGSVTRSFDEPVSFVFQDSKMLENLTLRENLMLSAAISSGKGDCDNYLEKYGLSDAAHHRPRELSAGQRQRAAVLRALLSDRPATFADEPTGNLDEDNAAAIASLLFEAGKRRLVVVVSHDRGLFEPLADRTIVLSNGQIVGDITKRIGSGCPTYSRSRSVLSNKNALKIARRAARNNIGRIAVTAVAMFVCLFVTAVGLNLLLTDPLAAKTAMASRDGAAVYELAKRGAHREYRYGGLDYTSMTDLDYAVFSDCEYIKYKNVGYGFRIAAENGTSCSGAFQRIYLTDTSPFEPFSGADSVKDGELIVSDVLADEILIGGADSPLPQTLTVENTEVTVTGIYRDNTSRLVISDNKNQFDACVMSYKTYERICLEMTAQTSLNVYIGANAYVFNVQAFAGFERSGTDELIYGKSENNANGLLLNEAMLARLALVPSEAVGEQITLGFSDAEGLHNEDFVIEGVYRSAGLNDPMITFNDYFYRTKCFDDINRLNQSGDVFGAALLDYDFSAIERLHDAGYCDYAYFSATAAELCYETLFLSWILIAVAAITMIVAAILATLFVTNMIKEMRADLGVLRSLGVKKNGLAKLLILQPLALVVISAVLTLAVHPVAVVLLNLVLSLKRATPLLFIYYNWPAAIIVIAGVIVFVFAVILIVFKRLASRSVIDNIYK